MDPIDVLLFIFSTHPCINNLFFFLDILKSFNWTVFKDEFSAAFQMY